MQKIVHVTLTAEKEDQSPEQAEKQNGFIEGFAKSVRKNLRKDAKWGWCYVTLTVTIFFKDAGHNYSVTGEDHLGGCSYASEADFVLSSGYYDDMIERATAQATEKLETIAKVNKAPV